MEGSLPAVCYTTAVYFKCRWAGSLGIDRKIAIAMLSQGLQRKDFEIMIPTNRPVRASDVRALQHKLGLTKKDVIHVVLGGVSVCAQGQIKPSVAQALTVRLLMTYGEAASPLKPTPTFGEFRAFIQSIDPIWQKKPQRFSVLFGRDRTAAARWSRRDDAVMVLPTSLRRTMQVIWNVLHNITPSRRGEVLDDIYQLQQAETSMHQRRRY